jgi:class 3 adenylate cyclase/tetratricopeptide (TPR) repeat protein
MHCPVCSEENPAHARFCLACGSPLAEPALVPTEERKVVSVLFVDLVGHTARSDHADPEDVRDRLKPYHARVKRELERFDGTLEKFVGDAVMAVFGAPLAHEDDAERAVRAGLRVLEAMQELGVDVRVAVNTGEAVVSLGARPDEGEGIVAGDVVNTTSRLQGAAPVGGLVVGEATFRATRHVIEYTELEPVTVKGKAGPLPLWRADAARSRFGVDVEAAAATPFVGRDGELGLLEQTFARTVSEGQIQLVTIVGEPGAGKSRLVAELRRHVDELPDLVRWRQGRCLPYGDGITFWALGEIVKAEAGILESDAPDEVSRKLVATVEDLAQNEERDWLTTRLAPLVGGEATLAAAADRSEAFAAWLRFIEAVASRQPLVIVIEDLHWADSAMVEFVEHIVDYATAVPLLVICTARPELYDAQPGWAGGKRNATTISLPPLSSDETARLVSALLAQAVLPASTQAVLLERAGGNPLYAEEFARMLADRGLIQQRQLVVELPEGFENAVPETVQALIAARIDTVPSDRKALLQDAAVVGKVFWSGAVASIGGRDEKEVADRLHQLALKELIRRSRSSSMERQTEYAFWHVLVRDVAYGQIPRAERVKKHRAAAEWIEQTARERVADHAELLAYHYEQALDLATAAGMEDEIEQIRASAAQCLVLAGDRAIALDRARAETYYRRAVDLLEAGSDRGIALSKLAQAMLAGGQFEDAETLLEQAVQELVADGNVLAAGQAMALRSVPAEQRGDPKAAERLAAEAIELLEGEQPGRELAAAYTQAALNFMLSSRPGDAVRFAEKAIPLADRFGVHGAAVRARQARGCSRCVAGDMGGLDDLEESLRLGLELGLGVETAHAYQNLGHLSWYEHGPARALELERMAVDFAESRGLGQQAHWARFEQLKFLFDLGALDELMRTGQEVLAWERIHGETTVRAALLGYTGLGLFLRGDIMGAARLAEEALPVGRASEDAQMQLPALTLAALLQEESGNLDRAVELVEELRTVTLPEPVTRSTSLPDAVRISVAAGATQLARDLVEETKTPARRTRHAIQASEAILTEARDDLDESIRLYAEVAERWAEHGVPAEHGQALLGVGRCLVASGEPAAGASTFAEARSIFSRIGAQRLVVETDVLLARATALSS